MNNIWVGENARKDEKAHGHEKMCLMSYANNKGADQTTHPCSLVNAFVFAA